jgi:hypothetical protein
MKRELYFILMADIIDSRKAQQIVLLESFKKIISVVNQNAKSKIVSPLTITLGDEFQGVLANLQSALEVIIQIEEEIINEKARFKLRYVLVEGGIETPINKKIAHEMLGSGLTEARNLLSQVKNSNERFYIKINNKEQSAVINNAFRVYQGLIDDWQIDKDYEIVNSFLKYKDYKTVAEKLNKDRSLMWKREKSIKIKEYLSLKQVVYYLSKK